MDLVEVIVRVAMGALVVALLVLFAWIWTDRRR